MEGSCGREEGGRGAGKGMNGDKGGNEEFGERKGYATDFDVSRDGLGDISGRGERVGCEGKGGDGRVRGNICWSVWGGGMK